MSRTLTAAALALVLTAPAPANAQAANPYLEAIGALMAAQLYTAFTYIGVTADAYAKGVYKAKQVRAMMNEAEGMLNNVAGVLAKVQATNIVPADKAAIAEGVAIIGLLRAEAKALTRFAGTAAPADGQAYDTARKQAWARIRKLLGK